MHSEFWVFLKLGFDHICDLQAYDHLLFVMTLCAVYRPADWRHLLILITAFTAGHSLTLALSAFDVVRAPAEVVELLIPVTILITALHNVWRNRRETPTMNRRVNYGLALFFGLIHGMGFANYFRSLFGEMQSVVQPLLAFNLGIEAGQLVIVTAFFAAYLLLQRFLRFEQPSWTQFVSGAGAGVAVTLILNLLIK
jgi:uncharacterized membrane protein YfcA